jgi:lysozyme
MSQFQVRIDKVVTNGAYAYRIFQDGVGQKDVNNVRHHRSGSGRREGGRRGTSGRPDGDFGIDDGAEFVNRATLKAELERDEGRRLQAYKDSRGWWTIGVGHLLGASPRMNEITDEECDALLDMDMTIAERRAISIIREAVYDSLDDARQRVLVNMAFNLGDGLADFKHFLAAVTTGDVEEACKEMEASDWWGQVGDRAVRLQDMWRSGGAFA